MPYCRNRGDLGRAPLEPAPLTMLYLGRVANLIAYLLLAATAVRLVPIHKWTMALVALMPMSVYLAAAVSADAVTLGLSLLVVALTLNLAVGSESPAAGVCSRSDYCWCCWPCSKQAYVGLAVLFLLSPARSSPVRGDAGCLPRC